MCALFKKGVLLQKLFSFLYKLRALLQELRAPLHQQNVCSVTKMCVYCFLNILTKSEEFAPPISKCFLRAWYWCIREVARKSYRPLTIIHVVCKLVMMAVREIINGTE